MDECRMSLYFLQEKVYDEAGEVMGSCCADSPNLEREC